MKYLYLIRKQFSHFFCREIVIMIQIVMLTTLSTPVFSKIEKFMAINKLAGNFSNSTLFFQADDYYFMPEFLELTEYQSYMDEIDTNSHVESVGRTAHAGCTVIGQGVNVYFYNEALQNNIHLNISDVEIPENTMPVIISHKLSEIYHLGDVILPENGLFFPVSAERIPAQFTVVGILEKDDSYCYRLVGGASKITLESIAYKETQPYMIAVDAFDIVPTIDINPSALLFMYPNEHMTADVLNMELGHLGHAESIGVMRQNSFDYILTTNPLPFVSAFLMSLLCLASVTSYAYVSMIHLREIIPVYYFCGLSRKKATMIALYALVLLMVVSIVISATALSLLVENTLYNGFPYSVFIIITLFFLSFIIMLTQYSSVNPIELMHKGD